MPNDLTALLTRLPEPPKPAALTIEGQTVAALLQTPGVEQERSTGVARNRGKQYVRFSVSDPVVIEGVIRQRASTGAYALAVPAAVPVWNGGLRHEWEVWRWRIGRADHALDRVFHALTTALVIEAAVQDEMVEPLSGEALVQLMEIVAGLGTQCSRSLAEGLHKKFNVRDVYEIRQSAVTRWQKAAVPQEWMALLTDPQMGEHWETATAASRREAVALFTAIAAAHPGWRVVRCDRPYHWEHCVTCGRPLNAALTTHPICDTCQARARQSLQAAAVQAA